MKKKISNLWHSFVGKAMMLWLWVKNILFVFMTTKSKVRVFEGYGHYWLAKKYADKRTKISALNKVAGGKRHFVIPLGDYSLVVLNRLEITSLKARGILSKKINIDYLLKNAYYISK